MATADAYLAQLQQLLPPGLAWPREPDAVLTKLLASIADGLARVDARAVRLMVETDSRSTLELIEEWETAVGLPDACIGPLDDIAERRDLATRRHTDDGGQSVAHFVALAAALGYEITIVEQRARWHGRRRMGEPYGLADWQFVWDVHAPETTVFPRHYGAARLGLPYATWGNQVLECEITKNAPAHTLPRFLYGA
jgi:uncharacterized protein YmfQ (DUF2313 family)